MKLHLCDWCERDIKGKKSATISSVPDADDDGNGSIDHRWDLCGRCFAKFLRRMSEMNIALSPRTR